MSRFESMLLTLSDEAFFELMRNYLGEIRTPFNKHDLIARLIAFLRKSETLDRMVELIDRADAQLLTTLWLLDEPTHERLFEIVGTERSYLELHHHLVNLEDRLLIYRDGERIRFVPEVLSTLERQVFSAEDVAPSTPVDDDVGEPWLTDALVASIFAFFREMPAPFKADGTLRKRAGDQLHQRIPALAGRPRRVEAALRVGRFLGVVPAAEAPPDAQVTAGGLEPLADASPQARACLYWAAAIAAAPADVSTVQRALLELHTALSTDRAFEMQGAARLLRMVLHDPSIDAARLLESLIRFDGVVATTADEDSSEHAMIRSVLVGRRPPSTESIVIQPNLEITVADDAPFADLLFIASVTQLIRHDHYPRFELTKESVARALLEQSGAAIIQRLESVAPSLPQNVRMSLSAWSQEYESIRLKRGVVLTAAPERRALIDHSNEVSAYIREVLAPGVYLVDERDVAALTDALVQAGIEVPPRLASVIPATTRIPPITTAPQTSLADRLRASARSVDSLPAPSETMSSQVSQQLDELSVSPEQRRELEERIHRKLILFPTQLQPGVVRDRKSEAKGLDYVGKVRLAEHAARTGDLLEIVERGPDGSPSKGLLRVHSLDRSGNTLYLVATTLPDDRDVRIPISKLSLVRTLRGTLYNR